MSLRLPRLTITANPDVRTFARAYNDAAAALEGQLARLIPWQYVDLDAGAAADVPFIVPHTLGIVPTMFVAQSEADAHCYATAADKQEWSTTIIKIRCTVANVRLRVKVEAGNG